MGLRPGTRLGTYEIMAPLGAGGMGEVYRAHDPRLGRDVAIKVLPAESLQDDAARARLLREARLAATLNHPNICTVHDVGEAGGHVYLAMELVDGQPLSDKIAERGAELPTESVVRYGAQIAAALAHAHDRHVIHRDLKGSNVLITPDGRVKVLDFGLARRAGERADEGGATLSMAPRDAGTIVGTPHFLAPEVLRGGTADERSDVWALGVLLHEMASGSLPFRGTTSFELAAAIMHNLPATLPEHVPTGLRQIIGRCLEKEPGERYARASELQAALETQPGSAGERPSGAAGVPNGPVRVPTSRRNPAQWLIAAAVTAALVTAVLAWFPKGPPRLNPNPALRVLDLPFVEIKYPGMSADGKWIAVPASEGSGHWGLYFMNLGGGEPREIVKPDPGVTIDYADVSPDGSQLAYEASYFGWVRPRLFVVPSLGGEPRLVGEGGKSPHWSPDGRRIGYLVPPAYSRSAALEIRSVRADGSDDRLEFADSLAHASAAAFAWSPDGRQVAWTRGSEGGKTQEIMVRTLATGAERELSHDHANINDVWWTRQGELVFSSNRTGNTNLWMMRASGGPAVQVTRSVGPDVGLRVSADGRTLLYLQRQRANNIWIGDVERGDAIQVTHDDRTIGFPSLSPDHQRLAVPVRDYDPLRSIWRIEIMDRDGGDRRTIVSGLRSAQTADWSPDGRSIAFVANDGSTAAGSVAIFLVDTTGGAPRRVGAGLGVVWANDSTLNVYDTWRTTLRSARDGRLIAASPDSTFWLPMSGGRTLVFDERHGREGWWVETKAKPAGSADARTLIAKPSDRILAPARDGSFLLYCPKDGTLGKILVPSGRRLPVFGAYPGLTPESIVWMSTDNREFVYLRPAVSSKLVLIENLR